MTNGRRSFSYETPNAEKIIRLLAIMDKKNEIFLWFCLLLFGPLVFTAGLLWLCKKILWEHFCIFVGNIISYFTNEKKLNCFGRKIFFKEKERKYFDLLIFWSKVFVEKNIETFFVHCKMNKLQGLLVYRARLMTM